MTTPSHSSPISGQGADLPSAEVANEASPATTPAADRPRLATLRGLGVLTSKPGQTLVWLAIFVAVGFWVEDTWFPEEAPAAEEAVEGEEEGGGPSVPISGAALAALEAAQETGSINEGTGGANPPIAARGNENKQGLVNLFKRIYAAVAGPEEPEEAVAAKQPGGDEAPATRKDGAAAGGGEPGEPKEAAGDGGATIVDSAPANEQVNDGEVKEFIDKKNSYGDEPVRIEDPHGAMKPFYEALKRTQAKEEGAITRVVQFGDSTIVADKITGTVRRKMQERFGDSGHGWLLVGKPWDYYIHANVSFYAMDGWKMNRLTSNPLKDGYHGLGGVTSRGIGSGLWAEFRTVDEGTTGRSISRFEVYYMAHKRGSELAVLVDGEEKEVINTRSEEVEDKKAVVTFPDGAHKVRIQLKSAGEARLYGVAMGRDTPGVVYDSLGVTGVRAKTWLERVDDAHFKGQLKMRDPHLVVVMLGTNESEFESMNMEEYEQEYEKAIQRIRTALPDRTCLIASPPDRAKKNRMGRMTTAPLIPQMAEIQREVAFRNKCAYWNTYEAMGGKGSMAAWYRNKPRLASGDFTHFTAAGGEVLGILVYEALMEGYEAHTKAAE